MEKEIFTPRIAGTDKRVTLDRKDIKVISGNIDQRGFAWRARIQIEDTIFPVRGASCGSGNCFCDAVIDPRRATKVAK